MLLSAWPHPARADPGSVGHHATMIDTAATFPQPQRTAARRDVVVLQGDRTADARRLKAHNPRLVVLAYLNLSAMSPAVPSGFSTGVQTHAENWRGKVTDTGSGYAARNERWFLHTRKGRRFTFRSYDWLWAANIADRGYQRRWTSNALRLLAARPEFDGLFIDDVNPTLRYHHDPADVRELPTDEAYAEATGTGAGGDRAARAGRSGGWSTRTSARGRTTASEVRPWLRASRRRDGRAVGEVRHAARCRLPRRGGLGAPGGQRRRRVRGRRARDDDHPLGQLRTPRRRATATRRRCWPHADGCRSPRSRDYHTETWFPDYERDLGAPTGPMQTHEGGLRSRPFKRGLVVVNPTASPQRTATGATLRPHSAVIQASSGQ